MSINANINPTPEQKLIRNMGRITTLKQAIANSKTKERAVSLQTELDRRLKEIESIQFKLNNL